VTPFHSCDEFKIILVFVAITV